MIGSLRDKNLPIVFYLGFASGLPLLLTLSTLSAWLKESGVDIRSIGLFALVGLPYSLKFLWAPFKDAFDAPILSRFVGRRLGWLALTQIMLAGLLWWIGFYNPSDDAWMIAALCFLIAFASASQDIVSDAYRIELQRQENLAAGAAVQSLGYRIGMLVAGAGSLYLATDFSWGVVYQIMGAVMAGCAIICLFCPRPDEDKYSGDAEILNLSARIVAPFLDFIKRQDWPWIMAFVLLYKLCDSLATSLATPFYLDMGFSKIEIANITKVFGMIAFIAGGFIGAEIVRRVGIMRGLWICGIWQMLAVFLFAIQAVVGHDLWMLTLTIGGENVTSGMGSAAFVAYLSALCNLRYTATQFALLTSLMAVGRTVLSAGTGFIVAAVGWPLFYIFAAFSAIPGLVILRYLMRRSQV